MTPMLFRRPLLGALAAGVLAAAIAAPQASQAQDRSYILATASTGGTYYPVGVALATLTKVKLKPRQGIDMSAINSAGSAENIRLLREDEAQFAILQGLFGQYARTGTGPIADSGPQDNLRSVTMLWSNVEHFIVASDHAATGTVDDLTGVYGQKFSMGGRNSGTRFSNEFVLGNLGIDFTQFDIVYKGYTPSVEDLQNGVVVGTNPAAGPPVGAVTQAIAAMGDGVTFLQFTPEQAERADGGTDLYSPYVIPAGTYPGQDSDWNTVAQPNFLGVNADVDEEAVYLITKTIYENLPFLQAIHKATLAMALDRAIVGLPVPLHPGAARYYAEQGVDIPDRLITE